MLYTVRSYIAVETQIDIDPDAVEAVAREAEDQAAQIIHQRLAGLDYDFMEDCRVYDEQGEELEEAAE